LDSSDAATAEQDPLVGAVQAPELASLYTQLRPRLQRLIRLRMRRHAPSVLSHADVDEVVQETFCRALHAIRERRYDGTRDLRAYLRGICSHVLSCLARDRSRERRNEKRLAPAEPCDLERTWTEAYERAHAERLSTGVSAWLGEQPPLVRELCHRRFWLAESQRVAAQTLQISRQRVRTLEGRMRAELERSASLLERQVELPTLPPPSP